MLVARIGRSSTMIRRNQKAYNQVKVNNFEKANIFNTILFFDGGGALDRSWVKKKITQQAGDDLEVQHRRHRVTIEIWCAR